MELRCLFAIHLKALKPKPKAYPNEINTIGDHIRKKRLDLGLLQEHVATQIGVTEITICNWETNRYEAETRHLPQIIRFLGYTPYRVPQSFGEWLQQCRVSWGLSQESLAKALEMDESTIAKWERGAHQATRKGILKAEAFFDPTDGTTVRPRHRNVVTWSKNQRDV